jgi:hypothetical protein
LANGYLAQLRGQHHDLAAKMSAAGWNRLLWNWLDKGDPIHEVPMAAITYKDVAPHLNRGLRYRRLRLQRWQVLHAHDHDPCGEYDPYQWAENIRIFELIVGVIVLAYFYVADSEVFSRANSL